ncbi:hypothetical protein BAG01nite_36370 [Brevibacillus agri]|uniref:Uncharacterized protein n=1 Tax=Brevibacillus agri TaxID=51101 RepID=A0A3M8BET6_9BACL|nr:hypothetical protein [Brevibacillus agri]QAV11484.1 hypothetical protein BA6348_00930 [Brevibacillus agri]RNB61415.1 hypothetical protein EB820_00850 [Brevibacillus agri]GED27535.1 hypothetical protein BAG01nite_36370 [Brevibacillus agri]
MTFIYRQFARVFVGGLAAMALLAGCAADTSNQQKGSGERIQRQPSRRDHAADTEGSLPDSGRLYGKHSGSRDVQSSHLGLAGTTAGWHPERRSAAAQMLAQAQRRTAEAGLAARVTLQEGTVDAPVTNIGLGRGRVLASTKPTRYDRFACPQAVTPIL